jgi:hypothetical protein
MKAIRRAHPAGRAECIDPPTRTSSDGPPHSSQAEWRLLHEWRLPY